jgi:hypothetical protein
MLIPDTLLRVLEYDAVYVVTPTSRQGHSSDTVLATVEMLIENDQADTLEFPFTVLSTDAGSGADPESVRPRVLNGSRAVEVLPVDEVDEDALARVSADRARAAGHTEADVRAVEAWVKTALQKAERVHRGRTRLKAGERRRIVLQQRLRVRPGEDGSYLFRTIAPSPIGSLATGGRVSLTVLLPFEDDDVRLHVERRTEGFGVEQGWLKKRQWIAWFWQNDPLLEVQYRYQ